MWQKDFNQKSKHLTVLVNATNEVHLRVMFYFIFHLLLCSEYHNFPNSLATLPHHLLRLDQILLCSESFPMSSLDTVSFQKDSLYTTFQWQYKLSIILKKESFAYILTFRIMNKESNNSRKGEKYMLNHANIREEH